jgi:outer membrane protein OmpA-like peptidoglycan-associated protein
VLSEQRAQAVVDRLVELGIAADRLSARGEGEAQPIADNDTDEGRADNRRIEFVIAGAPADSADGG